MSVLRAVARRALAARAGVLAPVASSAPVAVLRVTRSQSSLAAGAEGEELDHAPEAEVAFDESLPVYMTTLTFSEKGVQAMLNRDIDREKSAAKIIGLLGGRLQSYYVTTTGTADAVLTYTFPKNHDVQTLLYTLMGSGSYERQARSIHTLETTKLMSWADAAMSLRASRNVYGMGGVTCNISNVGGGGGGVGKD
ncbi:uncharacterized protein MICPUCDRAFT_47265 [Micromonas pusilla CCMP1545]|uniref:Predicted protein n=1 Tax=Micromonas pusilla (strain CCMP1545) TaxID=564608 RepID=C1MT54_MICPC|nr:uncharacterized protein MICPUCDRAFT_47265 [Micromonas pusilla CCMP1545]EEH56885.1 predicted protein [Micromonas pusilla CCMP1545]|eukprot:XP_003058430.1 predicted protein [Micromonas pusilla CCMP1545]